MSGTQLQNPFEAEVSSNHLTATIRLLEAADAKHVTTDDVIVALEGANVVITDEVTARAREYVGTILAGDRSYKPVTIAEGRPPQEGEDGRFEWDESLDPDGNQAWEDDDSQRSHYSVRKFTVVNAGDKIGRLIPPSTGAPGLDVHLNEIAPRQALREVALKENVSLAEDGETVIATESGRVEYQNLELRVVDVLEIAENVDFSVGHIDSPTAVNVRGNIQDLFHVRTQKWLTVGGAIEAAEVDVGGDLEVRGGILNRDKGHVRVGGALKAKFCSEANVRAEGDITIGKEVVNSRVHTESRLLIANGAVIGGSVSSRLGVEAKILGSDAGVPTEVGVGISGEFLREARSSELNNARRRAEVEEIRKALGPVLQEGRRLTPHQKERVAELMAQADAIEDAITRSEERTKEQLASMVTPPGDEVDCGPYVLVTSKICQGVSIRIDDRITLFVKEMKGPIKICKRKIKNHTVIAAVNQVTGSVAELHSRRIDLRDESGI